LLPPEGAHRADRWIYGFPFARCPRTSSKLMEIDSDR
jgi:hypothetical protein